MAHIGNKTAPITKLQTESPHAETSKEKTMQIGKIILITDIQVRDFKVWKHFTSGLCDLAQLKTLGTSQHESPFDQLLTKHSQPALNSDRIHTHTTDG